MTARKFIIFSYDIYPASILYKSTADRVADGPIAARCRFIKNAYKVWGKTKIYLTSSEKFMGA